MSISEMEESLGITDEDKIRCPFEGEYGCDDCKKGLDQETCEELYEEWLVEESTTRLRGRLNTHLKDGMHDDDGRSTTR